MMDRKNIDLFNEYTALIFARLYETFPLDQHFDPFKELGINEAEYQMCDKPLPREVQVFYATITWLNQTGYIAGDGSEPWYFVGRLTAKGLEAMKAVPASIDCSEPIGEKLLEAVKDGSTEAGKNLVAKLLTAAFQHFL